jgi:hypothetical protein
MAKFENQFIEHLRSWRKYNSTYPFVKAEHENNWSHRVSRAMTKVSSSQRSDVHRASNYKPIESVNKKVQQFCPKIYKIEKNDSRSRGSIF